MNAHEHEIADNRKLWDAWTAIHTTGSFYDVQRFRDNADDVRIAPWERAGVGDVAGKTLLHVQCHFGLDTLSWARLGAGHVTGVDFSEPAIAFADELAEETRLAPPPPVGASHPHDPRAPPARGSSSGTCATWRGRSPVRRSTSSTPAEARSGGCPTSARGHTPWRASCGPAASSTSMRGTRFSGRSKTSSQPPSSSSDTTIGGARR